MDPNRPRFCRITLIGMSKTGKTHLARRLADAGFRRYGVDDMIRSHLFGAGRGKDAIRALAAWMGFPGSEHYDERARRYQELERDCMASILDDLVELGDDPSQKVVIDTSGSVIYLGEALRDALRQATCVIHLETPPPVREQLYARFRRAPTPLIWDGFTREPGESPEAALQRNYRSLLERREASYRAWGEVTLGWNRRRSRGFDPLRYFRELGLSC